MNYAFTMVVAYALVVLTIIRFQIELGYRDLTVIAIVAGALHFFSGIPAELTLLGVLIGYVLIREFTSDIFEE